MSGDIAPGKNIVVIGPSCAGKSTLARELAGRLGLRYVELDALSWEPGWRSAPVEVFRGRVASATEGDGWAADGNYGVARDLLWPRVHTIIWLDFSLRVVMRRMVRRTWRRWRSQELLWGTNRERLWYQLIPHPDRSLFVYTLRTHRRRRREFEQLMSEGDDAAAWIRLRSPRELERWLRGGV